MKDPQTKRILEHLQKGFTLTVAEAITLHGCYALSQRCGDLRRMGYPIKDEWVKTQNGARIKRYYLVLKPEQTTMKFDERKSAL